MPERIVLCPNPYRDHELAVTREVKKMLEDEGFEVKVSPEYYEELPDDIPPQIECSDLYEVLPGAALVVSFGGDGTIMHTARRMIGHPIPVLGVNLGTVGFLAELDRSEIRSIVSAAKGKFTLSPRMMLKVELERGGEIVYSNYAMNDVSMHGVGQMIHMTAKSNGRKILEFSGDGVVIASPTGSTAYSMSAGGPIVEPTAENIIVTPICAHALSARSFVLAPNRVVTVGITGLHGKAVISTDGDNVEVTDGDILRVQKAEYQTLIAHVGEKTFFDIVFEKLGDRK